MERPAAGRVTAPGLIRLAAFVVLVSIESIKGHVFAYAAIFSFQLISTGFAATKPVKDLC